MKTHHARLGAALPLAFALLAAPVVPANDDKFAAYREML